MEQSRKKHCTLLYTSVWLLLKRELLGCSQLQMANLLTIYIYIYASKSLWVTMIYIYIYICVCECVCVCVHIYIYIDIRSFQKSILVKLTEDQEKRKKNHIDMFHYTLMVMLRSTSDIPYRRIRRLSPSKKKRCSWNDTKLHLMMRL